MKVIVAAKSRSVPPALAKVDGANSVHFVHTMCINSVQCAQCAKKRKNKSRIFLFLKILNFCAHFIQKRSRNPDPSQQALEVNAGRGQASCTHTTHGHVGGGALVGHSAACVGTHSAPRPQEALVNHPLRPTAAGPPDRRRAAHSAQTYPASNTARWPHWILEGM
jgi:hypothetical protein